MQRQAFTLTELMAVVIIIAILGTIAAPLYFARVEKSRKAEAVTMLLRMYKGYHTAIIDEDLVPCQNSYNLWNHTCSGNERRWFNPDESDRSPNVPTGRSDLSWKVIGFEENPNLEQDHLYFTYDFLKPNNWPSDDSHSAGPPPRPMRPNDGQAAFNGMNMGVAWRKDGNTKNWQDFYDIFPESDGKWYCIDLDTGVIYNGTAYQ